MIDDVVDDLPRQAERAIGGDVSSLRCSFGKRGQDLPQLSAEALRLLRQKNIAFAIWFAIVLVQISLPILAR